MKRLLSGIILMLFFITNVFAVNVFALDKEPITYGVNESFIIIVPSGFTFNKENKYTTEVVVKDVLVSHDKTLQVSISSDNYKNEWRANNSSNNAFIVYKIGTDNKYSVKNDDIVLSVNSGETYNGEARQPLYFIIDKVNTSGYYYDILTFLTSVR